MKDNIFQGTCELCGNSFAKKDMTRHLKACIEKKDVAEAASEKRRARQTGIFHLVVEGRFKPAYWLHLKIRSDSTLRDLVWTIHEMKGKNPLSPCGRGSG